MFLLNEQERRNVFCESYLFLLQVFSMLLLNFSNHSSKEIFQTPLNGHFSSPQCSNLRDFYCSILMKQLYVSKNSFLFFFILALAHLDLCGKEYLITRKNLFKHSSIIIQH